MIIGLSGPSEGGHGEEGTARDQQKVGTTPLGVCDTEQLRQAMQDFRNNLGDYTNPLTLTIDGKTVQLTMTPHLLASLALYANDVPVSAVWQILYDIQDEDWFNEFWEGKRLHRLERDDAKLYAEMVRLALHQLLLGDDK